MNSLQKECSQISRPVGRAQLDLDQTPGDRRRIDGSAIVICFDEIG
jgi:hypothetical protein